MKKISFFLISVLFSQIVWAGNDSVIYRQRVNWVKLEKVQNEEVPVDGLLHPYTSISTEQMEAMLLSIKIAQKYVVKKEVDSTDVFDSWEARKYAPMIVEGLAKANAEQVVSISIVHKRPFFILRNDRLTMGKIFVAKDGVHFQFFKLFAQLSGDYESSSGMDKQIRQAKTLRVTLQAQPGQVLSYDNAMEVIMNPATDFTTQVQNEQLQEAEDTKELMKGKKVLDKKSDTSPSSTDADPLSGESAELRLQKLDDLKKKKLISVKEYNDLRAKILSGI